MRFVVILVMSSLSFFEYSVFSSSICCGQKGEQATGTEASAKPVACALNALSQEQRKRHTELRKDLHDSVQEVRELSDGYALRFSGESKMLLNLAEFVSLERLCCPFFKFAIEVESNDRPVWLKLTGNQEVKQFLKSEFGLK